jgi:RNA polymerase sigma-70 factor (ECF subfamily)
MSDADESVDEELACRAQRGDVAAFDTLVRRYLRPSMALAWQFARDLADAEDIVQEAFHRAVRSLAQYDGRRPFAPWFYEIVRNVARNARGRSGRRAELAPVEWLDSEPEDASRVDPIARHDLGRALDSLAPMQQACVRLCDVEGFTSVEAGVLLGVGDATVRTHLRRARSRLRGILQPLGEDVR